MEPQVSEIKPGPVHTVASLAAAEEAFPEGSTRWIIFQHKDALKEAGAIFYVGKKLLIDRDRFIAFLQGGRAAA